MAIDPSLAENASRYERFFALKWYKCQSSFGPTS